MLFGTDSHTCTAGAFGEFATGIGNTDAGFVMGTGKLWVKVPPTMRFVFHGELPPYLMAKDLILAVIGDIGCDGATYRAMEFDGDGVYALNIEERMTLCNMVIEAGGKNGVIAPDKVTLDYVNARNKSGKPYTPVNTDAGAKFDFEKVYDVTKLEPVVAKPHSPDNRAFVSEVQRHEARPRLHRLLHRRQDDRLPGRGQHPQGQDGQDRHLRRAGDERDRRGSEDGEAATARRWRRSSWRRGRRSASRRAPPAWAARATPSAGSTRRSAASARPTAISPAAWGTRRRRSILASPLTVAASAVNGVITDPREYVQ